MSIQPSNDIHIYKLADVMSYIINRYIQTYEAFVYKNDDGKYVFTKVMSDKNIQSSFNLFLRELVYTDKFMFGNRNTVIVCGSFPFMNWRRSHYDDIKDNGRRVIDNQMLINYVMTDRSIKIDEYHLSSQITEWFITLMNNPKNITQILDVKEDVVSLFMNKNLSELDIINMIKGIFGESRVSVKDIDCIKTIAEFNTYIFKDVENDDIPEKLIAESIFYIRQKLGME